MLIPLAHPLRPLQHAAIAILIAVPWTIGAASLVSGCAEAGPILASLAPLAETAVEAVTKAARAQGRDVAPEVLAAAVALDKAHEASEAARDKQLRLILAAVRRKPVACVPDAGAVALPVALVDAGAEGGR